MFEHSFAGRVRTEQVWPVQSDVPGKMGNMQGREGLAEPARCSLVPLMILYAEKS